jgi:hypothetical protein
MSRKSRPGSRYVGLPHYLLDCPAFKSLPGDAVKLLIYIWKRHNGVNNGEISYGVREAAEIGITKSSAGRMVKILIERGFLAVVRDSAFNVKTRHARTWRLTAEPYRGQQGTKEFMRWKPSQPSRNSKHSPTSGTDSPTSGTRVIKLPVSVPPAGLKGPESPPPESHQRDTYRLPRGGGLAAYPDGKAEEGAAEAAGAGGGPAKAYVTNGSTGYQLCVRPVAPGADGCPEHAAVLASGNIWQ